MNVEKTPKTNTSSSDSLPRGALKFRELQRNVAIGCDVCLRALVQFKLSLKHYHQVSETTTICEDWARRKHFRVRGVKPTVGAIDPSLEASGNKLPGKNKITCFYSILTLT